MLFTVASGWELEFKGKCRNRERRLMELKNVFTPITIAGIEIRNRVRMSPMALGYAEDGRSTERFARFFEERAQGGVGLICWALWPYKTEHGYFPWISADEHIPGVRLVADTVHRYGTKIVAQIGTGYAWAFGGGPLEIIGPSGISLIGRPGTPFRAGTPTTPDRLKERALTVAEIHEMVEGYGDAGRRLKEAHIDGVELMLAGGYTLARFVSAETNKRTDEYGGALDNRLRIIDEIIQNIKKKAGPDFPVSVKISGAQFTKNGYTLEECANEIVPRLEKMGICAVDVVVGWHEAPVGMLTNSVRPGQFFYLAEEIKKKAKIPVIGGTRTNDLRVAEPALAAGKMDMITLGRQLIADPETVNKAKEGRFEDIRPCISCSWCLETVDSPVICSSNPRAGHECEYVVERAKKPAKVLVVGGGPGGIEAALTAAGRGHKVTLIEKQNRLGGMLEAASIAPFKDDTGLLLEYYRKQIGKSKVKVKLGKEATVKDVRQMNPDVVILATGGAPIVPKIPGAAGPNVAMGADVLLGNSEVGDRVVIVGGGMVGCETAEYLLQKGKKVIMLEMLPRIASDVPRAIRFDLVMRLRKAGLQIEPNVEVTRITKYGAWGVRKSFEYGPNEVFFEGDTIVLAVGVRSENRLAQELEGKIPVHRVGDCAQGGQIKDAVRGGFLAGLGNS